MVRVSGTAQDITDLVLADGQAEESARRLFLLQGMATAANQAESLRDALQIAGAGVPEYTSWAPLGAQLWDGGPEFLELDTRRPTGRVRRRARRARPGRAARSR